jgi:hypothetical protein
MRTTAISKAMSLSTLPTRSGNSSTIYTFNSTRRRLLIGGLCAPLTGHAVANAPDTGLETCATAKQETHERLRLHELHSIEDVLAVPDIAALFSERAMTGLDFADLSCIVREYQSNANAGSRMHVVTVPASASDSAHALPLRLDGIQHTLSSLSSLPLRACLAVLVCDQHAPVVSLAKETHAVLKTLIRSDGIYACAAVNALPGETTRVTLLTVHR